MKTSGDMLFGLRGHHPETLVLLKVASVMLNIPLNTLVPHLLDKKIKDNLGYSSLTDTSTPLLNSEARRVRHLWRQATSHESSDRLCSPNNHLRDQAIKIIDSNGFDGLSAQLLNKHRYQQQVTDAIPHLLKELSK